MRWTSTALDADYSGSVIRYDDAGLCDRCSAGSAPGQPWSSIGAWYNPVPWSTASPTCPTNVQNRLAQRVLAQPGF